MREEFVQTVWKYQLFDRNHLRTSKGLDIEVIHQGFLQHHSGPDFSAARIIIDGVLWVGNVEIHVNAKEWNQHRHFADPAFDNVILHVVYSDDHDVCKTNTGRELPCLEIASRIPSEIIERYERLANDYRVFPCAKYWQIIQKESIKSWLVQLALQRIEEKLVPIKQRLHDTKFHWEQVCFELIAKQLGFHVNAEPMLRMARTIPIEIIQKNADQPRIIEALLYGQAGMLNRLFIDEYPKQLKRDYLFLKKKYQLQEIDQTTWKFARLRPLNFPTIRIAQLAALLSHQTNFFKTCISMLDSKEMQSIFKKDVHSYWQNHYVFDKESKACTKNLGQESIENLLMNTIILLLFSYGQYMNESVYISRAIEYLEKSKVENNVYTNMFKDLGYKFGNALESQGLRFLWENYCDEKKCLNCNIGIKSLNIT
jgi:hypothetical protein